MNEQHYAQKPGQPRPTGENPGKSSYEGKGRPDPCDEAAPPQDNPHPTLPCPPKEECPPPKPCPDPPKRPPDPCDEKPPAPYGGTPVAKGEPSGGAGGKPTEGGYTPKPTAPGYTEGKPTDGGYAPKPTDPGYTGGKPTEGEYTGGQPTQGGYTPTSGEPGSTGEPSHGEHSSGKPTQGGYGDKPTQGSYGEKPTHGGYGEKPEQGGYVEKPQGAYAEDPTQSGYTGGKPTDGGQSDTPGEPGDTGGKPGEYKGGKTGEGETGGKPTGGGGYGGATTGGGGQPPGGYGGQSTGGATTGQPPQVGGGSPAEHLEQMKKKLETGQRSLQQLEPLKAEMADLAQRIQAFEKLVEGQAASETAWKDFYRATQLAQSDLECFIPTARCQIELTDKQKKCVCDAIAAVDARVKAARDASAAQKAIVEGLERDARKAARELEWTKRWYEFLKTGLQQQITKRRDDLKALKGLVTPTANPCEAYFHLYELELLTQSNYGADEACWKDDMWLGTFLHCWPWENYQKAWNRVLVEFNTAEAEDKLVKTKLDGAKKLAIDLEKLATDAVAKRREWILKEIKAKDCCGPLSKCP